jgi:hypothetical protein
MGAPVLAAPWQCCCHSPRGSVNLCVFPPPAIILRSLLLGLLLRLRLIIVYGKITSKKPCTAILQSGKVLILCYQQKKGAAASWRTFIPTSSRMPTALPPSGPHTSRSPRWRSLSLHLVQQVASQLVASPAVAPSAQHRFEECRRPCRQAAPPTLPPSTCPRAQPHTAPSSDP